MPLTSRSSSVDSNGAFLIRNIPTGTYPLIFSRVGYDRQTISTEIENSESLYFQIALHQTPIRGAGIDIVADPPDVSGEYLKHQKFFFPQDSSSMYCYYGSGTTYPIGMMFTDSGLYMYSFQTAILDSEW